MALRYQKKKTKFKMILHTYFELHSKLPEFTRLAINLLEN